MITLSKSQLVKFTLLNIQSLNTTFCRSELTKDELVKLTFSNVQFSKSLEVNVLSDKSECENVVPSKSIEVKFSLRSVVEWNLELGAISSGIFTLPFCFASLMWS